MMEPRVISAFSDSESLFLVITLLLVEFSYTHCLFPCYIILEVTIPTAVCGVLIQSLYIDYNVNDVLTIEWGKRCPHTYTHSHPSPAFLLLAGLTQSSHSASTCTTAARAIVR